MAIHEQKPCLYCGTIMDKTLRRQSVKQWKMAKYCNQSCKAKARVGILSPRWKDETTYAALHMRIRAKFGKPIHCDMPDCLGISKVFEWSNVSGEYKYEDNDWWQLCAKCHRNYDVQKRRGNACFRGHEFTSGNTYIPPKTGRRECITCRLAAVKRFQQRRRVALSL